MTEYEKLRAGLGDLAALCERIARGDYEKARALFALSERKGGPVAALAEAFGLMLVKLEAREYEHEELAARLAESCKELERRQGLLSREYDKLRENIRQDNPRLIGRSRIIKELLRQTEKAAGVHATVLISGETGTGKGLLAKLLHYGSPRASGPFVAINCAAIPATLLESELFGIEQGVASGVNARIGSFEQASGGTIFLDEIGDMPLESQAKILHVLENGSVERVGGRKSIPVDLRIIAATHRDLAVAAQENTFRADLYYRLNVIRLHMPALRERKEDIPLLARHFLEFCALRNYCAARSITPQALALLKQHDWPGNIRELENETGRAALLARGGAITPEDLSPTLAAYPLGVAGAAEAPPSDARDYQLPVTSHQTSAFSHTSAGRANNGAELARVNAALERARGNKSEAARLLGLSREGLRKKLKRLLQQ